MTKLMYEEIMIRRLGKGALIVGSGMLLLDIYIMAIGHPLSQLRWFDNVGSAILFLLLLYSAFRTRGYIRLAIAEIAALLATNFVLHQIGLTSPLWRIPATILWAMLALTGFLMLRTAKAADESTNPAREV